MSREGLSKNYRVGQLVAVVAAERLDKQAKAAERKWKRQLTKKAKERLGQATAMCEVDAKRSLPRWMREE